MRQELISLSNKVEKGLLYNSEERRMRTRAFSAIGTGEMPQEEVQTLFDQADESRSSRRRLYLESIDISAEPGKFEKGILKAVGWLEKVVKPK